MSETVSLSFPLEVEDEWPPVAIECLPFRKTSQGYELLVAPLFVKGLSVGDVIDGATDEHDVIATWHHVSRSRRTTIWLLRLQTNNGIDDVLKRLGSVGCKTVRSEKLGCAAVDVPESVDIATVDEITATLDGESVAVAYPSMRHAEPALSDPDNDLPWVVQQFLGSDDRCWHIDRHVLDPAETFAAEDVRAACGTALDLMRRWAEDARAETRVIVSSPIALIDDEWLENGENPPPPHVYICIARDRASFEPVGRDSARTVAKTGVAVIDALLAEDEVVARSDPFAPGEPGAWIVRAAPR